MNLRCGVVEHFSYCFAPAEILTAWRFLEETPHGPLLAGVQL